MDGGGQPKDTPKRSWFYWITALGFWWSVLSLAYSLRTTDLAVAKLTDMLGMLSWAITSIYAFWGGVRDTLLLLTRPIYDLLPWETSLDFRDAATFGFFLGVRAIPIITDLVENGWPVPVLKQLRARRPNVALIANGTLAALAGLTAALLLSILWTMDHIQSLDMGEVVSYLGEGRGSSSPTFTAGIMLGVLGGFAGRIVVGVLLSLTSNLVPRLRR